MSPSFIHTLAGGAMFTAMTFPLGRLQVQEEGLEEVCKSPPTYQLLPIACRASQRGGGGMNHTPRRRDASDLGEGRGGRFRCRLFFRFQQQNVNSTATARGGGGVTLERGVHARGVASCGGAWLRRIRWGRRDAFPWFQSDPT